MHRARLVPDVTFVVGEVERGLLRPDLDRFHHDAAYRYAVVVVGQILWAATHPKDYFDGRRDALLAERLAKTHPVRIAPERFLELLDLLPLPAVKLDGR